jgi:HSP20 family protein
MANQITRINPFREMANMQNAFDRFFEDWRPFSNDMRSFFNEGFGGSAGNMLAIDAHEDDKQYTITTELPGVQSENINVRQDGDYLLIEATIPDQTTEQQDENKRWLVRERRSGHFSRRIRLPQNVNFDNASADYHDGVLTLTLPKAENAQPRQIPVKSGNGNSQPNTVVGKAENNTKE